MNDLSQEPLSSLPRATLRQTPTRAALPRALKQVESKPALFADNFAYKQQSGRLLGQHNHSWRPAEQSLGAGLATAKGINHRAIQQAVLRVVQTSVAEIIDRAPRDIDLDLDLSQALSDGERAAVIERIEEQCGIRIPYLRWQALATVRDLIDDIAPNIVFTRLLARQGIAAIDERSAMSVRLSGPNSIPFAEQVELMRNVQRHYGVRIHDEVWQEKKNIGGLVDYMVDKLRLRG